VTAVQRGRKKGKILLANVLQHNQLHMRPKQRLLIPLRSTGLYPPQAAEELRDVLDSASSACYDLEEGLGCLGGSSPLLQAVGDAGTKLQVRSYLCVIGFRTELIP